MIVDELDGPQASSSRSFQMESHQLCYYVLGLVHSIWSPIPGALQDFIGSPKTNGYQSLHTKVVPLSILSKNCPLLPIEVQIRTANMDRLADLGVAAANWLPDMQGARLGLRLGLPMMPIAGNGHALSSTTDEYSLASITDSCEEDSSDGFANGSNGTSCSSSSSSGGNGRRPHRDRMQSLRPSSNGSLTKNDLQGKSETANTKGRNFWMGVASYMLESVAAGGNSLAAIAGYGNGNDNDNDNDDGNVNGSSSSSNGNSSSSFSGTAANSNHPEVNNTTTTSSSSSNGASTGMLEAVPTVDSANGANGMASTPYSSSHSASTLGSLHGNGNGNGRSAASNNGSVSRSYSNGNGVLSNSNGQLMNGNNNGRTANSPTNGRLWPQNGNGATSQFMPSFVSPGAVDANWLTQMRKWQEDFVGSLSAREFVDGVTAEVLGQSVFVYTHTGELRRLPKVSMQC